MNDYEKKLNDVISYSFREQASDIHLASDRVPMMRISGELVQIPNLNILSLEDIISILAVMVSNQEKIEEVLLRRREELDFAYEFNHSIRLRGNAYFQQGRLSVALRIIPKVRSFEELQLPIILKEFARMKQGFFLVVGPVGQGKSTTMASMIDLINQERKEHIITIEQPVEYVFEEKKSIIDQREVGLDTGSFKDALKSAFRQDANVIMIGEMRDAETIGAAVTAAETGHLVLSTLHTNNASQTIDRIIDSFPGDQQEQIRTQLANSLTGILSQRLIPKVSGGLIPAFELLVNTKDVANLIREGRTHEIDILIETGREHGMIDMSYSLATLVQQGQISVDNAKRYAFNEKSLINIL
jgi:twitching motility protein PilT